MSFKKVCSKIAKREGKKSQITIGNVREVMKIFTDIVAEENLKTGTSKSLYSIVDIMTKKISKGKKTKKQGRKK
jgi:hypothetical protein